MVKSNSYFLKITDVSVFVATCIVAIFFTSCSYRYSDELKVVKDLQERLDSNEANLNLDAPLFSLRAEHIETTLRTFKNDYTKTMSKELGDNLSKYKNFKKIYMRGIRKYDDCVKEQAELVTQLSNLSISLGAGELTKEEFKSYFRKEKIDVENLLRESKTIGKNLYEIEPEYTRITEYLEPIIANIEIK